LTRREWQQQPIYTDHQQKDSSDISSIFSRGNSVSNSTSLSEKDSLKIRRKPLTRREWQQQTSLSEKDKKGLLTEFFNESPKTKSYCFSADGQSLLLWIRYGAEVVFYDISAGGFEKWPAKDVISFAAAGAKLYAVISSNGNVIHL
jgi:hypothetical protein